VVHVLFANFLNEQDVTGIHIFLGNEACDTDSFVSSVLYAYLSSNIQTRDHNLLMLPIIPIPKCDLTLRTDISFLLQKSGFTCWSEVLMFVDEFSPEKLEALHKKCRLKVTLLDHNEPKKFWKPLTDAVVEVIDHHEDSGIFTKQAQRHVDVEIEKVGSATTLVARRFFRENETLITPAIAMLLLGPILMDTVNLNPQRHRVTPTDEEVARKLLVIAQINQNAFFEELQAAKFNDESLTTWDKLRKDYKGGQVGNIKYGISSVLTSVKSWLQQEQNLVAQFKEWMKTNENLDILFVGLAYYDTQRVFHRELIVYSSRPELASRVSEKLPTEFKLTPLQDRNALALSKQTPGLLFFTLGNVDVARKVLQPALDTILRSQL